MSAILTGAGLALGVALVLALERRGSRLGIPVKAATSALFVGLGWSRLAEGDPVGAMLLAGLGLCAVGDVLLAWERGFDAGLLAFLVGHLAYAAAFHRATPIVRWPLGLAVPLVALAALVVFWLWPRLGARRVPVLAYTVAIALMVWGAAATVAAGDLPPRTAVGAGLFFVSDLFVARERFVTAAPVNRLAGLPLYYAGQLSIALAIGAG